MSGANDWVPKIGTQVIPMQIVTDLNHTAGAGDDEMEKMALNGSSDFAGYLLLHIFRLLMEALVNSNVTRKAGGEIRL